MDATTGAVIVASIKLLSDVIIRAEWLISDLQKIGGMTDEEVAAARAAAKTETDLLMDKLKG